MKFMRSIYPDIPGRPGDPCWQVTGRWLWFDADWNTRFPFGTSMCLKLGRQKAASRHGFTIDVNPPLGEPNRLYFFLGRWQVIVGLLSVRDFRETGRTTTPRGTPVIQGVHFSNWRHPHIDGCSRYKYHQDDTGKWVRDSKPAPLHWGWLTISRSPAQ